MRIVPLAAACCLIALTARADHVVDYYAIRPLPALGIAIIEHGDLRGERAHRRARGRRQALARQGIYLADGAPRVARHVERFKLGEHRMRIALTITPPPGRGIGGANYWASLKVVIDGVTKIDSWFGYHAEQNELDFKRIVLFEDGLIHFEASFLDQDGNSHQLLLDDFGGFSSAEQLAKKLDNAALQAALAAGGKRKIKPAKH